MKTILCLLAALSALPCFAQNELFDGEAFWKALRWSKEAYAPDPRDTVILVASNRAVFADTALRRVGEGHSSDGSVRFYIVASRDEVWRIHPVGSLRAGMSLLRQAGAATPMMASSATGSAPLSAGPQTRQWIVFAEGYGKIFTSGIDRGLRMAAQYGQHLLYLDYPSYNTRKSGIGNFYFSRSEAKHAALDFAPVLDSLYTCTRVDDWRGAPVTFFTHSMGAHILREGITAGHFQSFNRDGWMRVVMNAPCVPQRRHRRWIDSMRMASTVVVHFNPEDYVLKGAHLLTFTQQLGEAPRSPLSSRAVYINFHQVAGRRHSNFITLRNYLPVIPVCIEHYRDLLIPDRTPALTDTSRYVRGTYLRMDYGLKL